MKLKYHIIFLTLFIISCKKEFKKTNENGIKAEQIELIIKEIDSLKENNKLKLKEYSLLSTCGGHLTGYYKNDILQVINEIYYAELGYSKQDIYWNNENVVKIIYQEHFAEWEKYDKNYPPEKFKYDSTKMTYSDTIYELILADKIDFKKISGNKTISTTIDSSLVNRLLKCAYTKKTELENDTDE